MPRYSPHMRKVYGDSLRKEAGLTKTIKMVATKNVRLIPGKQARELGRVAREVKGTFDKVMVETAEVVEDFIAKCTPCPVGLLVKAQIAISSPTYDIRGGSGDKGSATTISRAVGHHVGLLIATLVVPV